MSRFFSPRTFCAKCNILRARDSLLVTPQGVGARTQQSHSVRSFNQQQQRRFTGESNRFGFRRKTKSLVWFCGSAGLAVAVGLNYQNDSVKTSCKRKEARTIDRYSDARKVSRDLVERIKVSSEVGMEGFVPSFPLCVYACLGSTHTTSVSVVTQAEVGAPGVVVGVSVDGSLVWSEGLYLLYSPFPPWSSTASALLQQPFL